MTLEASRSERIKARGMVKQGKNPAQIRKEKIQLEIAKVEEAKRLNKNTFESVALEWISQQGNRWSQDHTTAVRDSLRNNIFPTLSESPVDNITPPMILKVIRPIEKRGSLEIASKSTSENHSCISLCCPNRQGYF